MQRLQSGLTVGTSLCRSSGVPRQGWLLIVGLLPLLGANVPGQEVGPGVVPRFRISPETTYLTGPLDPLGYVDYVAAVNRRSAEGISPDANAAIPYLEAVAPASLLPGDENLREYAGRLDVDRLNFADPPLAATQLNDDWTLRESLDAASRMLWTAEEHPELARWLDQQRPALERLIAAGQRERFHAPLLAGPVELQDGRLFNAGMLGAGWPGGAPSQAVRILAASALRHAGRADYDRAIVELDAGLRLARHLGRANNAAALLISRRCQSTLLHAVREVLAAGQLSRRQIIQMRDRLDRLPAERRLDEFVNEVERLVMLDTVRVACEHGIDGLELINELTFRGTDADSRVAFVALPNRHFGDRPWSAGHVRWEQVLRNVNSWYDRIADCSRLPPGPERRQRVIDLDEEVGMHRVMGFVDAPQIAAARVGDLAIGAAGATGPLGIVSVAAAWLRGPITTELATRTMSHLLLGLTAGGLEQQMSFDDAAMTQLRMTRLAIALTLYREAHGVYPPGLDDLPLEAPPDVYTGRKFEYESTGARCTLTSPGPDGILDAPDAASSDDLLWRPAARN